MTNKIAPLLSNESIAKIQNVMKQIENKKPEIAQKCDPELVEKCIKFIDQRLEVFQWLITGSAGRLKVFKPKNIEQHTPPAEQTATRKIIRLLNPESVEKINTVIEQLENKKLELVERLGPDVAAKYIPGIDGRLEVLHLMLTGLPVWIENAIPKADE
ncbi:MAG: hypothetical protein FWG39_01955 [Alphaproteobacteria bacterium]|nr:hypothetical protein [Alphaproteobacteria bacterium]